MNKKEKNNGCIKIGCLFAVLIIAMLLIFGSKESEPYCKTSELYKFANSYEDLIETHKASGVIKQAWEGTAEEYAAAIAIGELSPDDEYRIIEYLPGYTIMDENGEITEQMD